MSSINFAYLYPITRKNKRHPREPVEEAGRLKSTMRKGSLINEVTLRTRFNTRYIKFCLSHSKVTR